MSSSPWVIDATEADFQQQVVERSRDLPIVLDFWAPWCGPCRSLGPALEKLAEEGAGTFLLAKVNVDDNPNLAGEFGVSGIPAVFAVKDATVVDQFVGMLPEEELQAFVQRLSPSETETALRAATAFEATDAAAAEREYRKVLTAEPGHETAKVGLARTLLAGTGSEVEVKALLRGVEVGPLVPEAERLRRVLRLRDVPHADADLTAAKSAADARPDDANAQYELGVILAARGKYTDALETLIAAAELDKKLAGSSIRELMVEIFHVIGVRSPEADAYRDRLRGLLY